MEYTLEELLITGGFVHIFRNKGIPLFSLSGRFFHRIHTPYNDDEYRIYILIIISTANRERG